MKHTPKRKNAVARQESTDKQTAKNGTDARKARGRFAAGSPGGPGRPLGKPNRVTALLREDIAEAYHQRGGVKWLRSISDRDFVRLLEKTLPREIAATLNDAATQRPVQIVMYSELDTTGVKADDK